MKRVLLFVLLGCVVQSSMAQMMTALDTLREIYRLDKAAITEEVWERDFFAIRYSKRSLRLKEQYFGASSRQALYSRLELSRLYASNLQFAKSAHMHNIGYNSYVELLKQEFCNCTESQRVDYWETASKYVNHTISQAHKFARRPGIRYSTSMFSAAYNASLLSKGILLNTSIGFENHVYASGIDEAIRCINQKKILQQNGVDVAEIDTLDRQILGILEAAGKRFVLPHLSITWQDVACELGDDDVAIEFYCTPNKEYGALMIRKDWKHPRLIRLKSGVKYRHRYLSLENAIGLLRSHTQNGDSEKPELNWALSKAIWNDDVVKYLPTSEEGKVYYSVDGLLQLIAIEELPFARQKDKVYRMSNIYNLYRLSSTRVLALDTSGKREFVPASDTTPADHAVLYGGLLYDLDDKTMLQESGKYKGTRGFNLIGLRGASEFETIQPLPQTLEEVDSISSMLRNHQASHVGKLCGEQGNEESFKSMTEDVPQLLHVATHGFYIPSDAVTSGMALTSMQKTGLLLAGAQRAFMNDYLPEGVEDGILTSQEISQLNLNGLKMVVLSACETALGDITNDGVAGLQRGFKMAGANSIVMTLWKVDDEATCKLMTEFYSNWITRKMTKHDALEAAKKTVRETPGWEDPKYWAAFILLDGLD